MIRIIDLAYLRVPPMQTWRYSVLKNYNSDISVYNQFRL